MGKPEENNYDIINIIGLEGVTPAVTNTLIDGEIDELCKAAMSSAVTDKYQTESEDFAFVCTIICWCVSIRPQTHYQYQ